MRIDTEGLSSAKMHYIGHFGWKSTQLWTVLAFMAVPLLGLLDYLTGPELSFSLFYLLPIVAITWLSGRKAGILASCLAATTWLTADLLWMSPAVIPAVLSWNAIVRLVVLLVVVVLLSEVRGLNERLEARVKERTAALTQEIAEHKDAEERVARQVAHLKALRKIDLAISSSFELRFTLAVIVTEVMTQLGADAADVLLLDSDASKLEYVTGLGLSTDGSHRAPIGLGETYARRIVLDQQMVYIPDLRNPPDEFPRVAFPAGEGFACYHGIPLISKGETKGVLEVLYKKPLEFNPEWLEFLQMVAGQASIAIDDAHAFSDLQRSHDELAMAYDATIEGWSRALDLRDKETEGHTQRVTEMTLELARLFRLPETEMVHIRRGALLHDIGKLGVPDRVLSKPGELTDEEWKLMKMHPVFAYDLLSPIRYLQPALDIPYCHHEKWDGTGYPRHLRGTQIPLAARIFAVVDMWDALVSDRPYRARWSEERARAHIREQAGFHFDPDVVQVCLNSGLLVSQTPMLCPDQPL